MNSLLPLFIVSCFSPGQIQFVDSGDFAKDKQLTVLLATVRIHNVSQSREGSGVLIGKSTAFVYILTAEHLIHRADRLEVAVFTKASYPRPHKTFHSAEKAIEGRGLADLGLLRLALTDDVQGILRICPATKVPKAHALSLINAGCDAGMAPTLRLEKNVEKKMGRRPASIEQSLFWEIPAKYPPGRSGGPLVDPHGYLLGICSGTNRERTYFTHVDEIHRFLKTNGYRWLFEEKMD